MPITKKGNVGMSGMSGQIRNMIISFEGEPFRSSDLPKYKAMHALLGKLVKSGELRVWTQEHESGKSNNKPRYMYQETKLNCAAPAEEPKELDCSAWREVYHEFFTPPVWKGQKHIYKEAM